MTKIDFRMLVLATLIASAMFAFVRNQRTPVLRNDTRVNVYK